MRLHFARLICIGLLLAAGGCMPERHFETMPTAKPSEIVKAKPKSLVGIDAKRRRPADLKKWDGEWQALQIKPESVKLGDHWRVCELKFRFRNYRELFHCLDLIEARTARMGEKTPEHRYAPVLLGWMRAFAYAELGNVDEALKWAESGWAMLPDDYHRVSWVATGCASIFCKLANTDDFAKVAIEAGGVRVTSYAAQMSSSLAGKNNPAGLDLRPPTITMALAAERAVLHAQRGEQDAARQALADLERWLNLNSFFNSAAPQFMLTAETLAVGPLYALGDYSAAVSDYEAARSQRRGQQFGQTIAGIVNPLFWIMRGAVAMTDLREFSAALDDASDAFAYAASLSRLGAIDRAEAAFDGLIAAPEVRDMGGIYWQALYERSRIARAKGQRAAEIQFLQRAVDAIEQVRGTISFEAGKIGFGTTTQAVYAALVAAQAEAADWSGAFITAERAKARALVDLLAQIHDLAPPPDASAKVRALLASATTNDGELGLPGDLEFAQTRDIVLAARVELPQISKEAASLISAQSIALSDIAARLASDETLIDYFSANDNLYAFVVNGTNVKGVKLPGAGLQDQVRALRAAIESDNASAEQAGAALFDRLIRPLAAEIHGDKITISPHGVLHYLPFAALRDGDQYLIDRYNVRMTPSGDALAYLKTDLPPKAGKLLALGNPDLGDARYDLPNAQHEALTVAQLFPDSRALVRSDASKTAVKELGSGFAILHFASHAMFDPDAPLNSGLYLAKGKEADGRLTVGDLYTMRLDVQLVTLSACQTGLGKILSGDDIIGLTRGFLFAGARNIVASLWSVDDAATAELMVHFYQNLGAHTQREALRLAQIQTRQNHPSPKYWAAFEITGTAN